MTDPVLLVAADATWLEAGTLNTELICALQNVWMPLAVGKVRPCFRHSGACEDTLPSQAE